MIAPRSRLMTLVVAVAIALVTMASTAGPAAADTRMPHRPAGRHGPCCHDRLRRAAAAKHRMTRQQRRALIDHYLFVKRHGGPVTRHQPPCTRCMWQQRHTLADGTVIHATVTHSANVAPHNTRAAAPRSRRITECGWVSRTVSAENITGDSPWRYTQRMDWCWTSDSHGNPAVVSHSPAQISEKVYSWAGADGWSAGGRQDESLWDYYGNHWVWRSYTEGKFDFCPPRIWCFQTVYPYIYIDIYGDGTYDSYWGK